MKVDKQLPLVTPMDPQGRHKAVVPEAPVAKPRPPRHEPSEALGKAPRDNRRSGYSVQLNRQLTSMQSAQSYLSELSQQLGDLKLTISRHLSAPPSGEQASIRPELGRVSELLAQRTERTGGSLDPAFGLSLNEPARSRFSLPGLESIDKIRASGRETLVFRVGRGQADPLVVALDDDMKSEQILRRFNGAFGRIGIRTELGDDGSLRFTSRETDWQRRRNDVAVQAEGKLYPKGQFTRLQPKEESFLTLDDTARVDSFQEMRRLLDGVVKALDRIAQLNDQLTHRQAEIREFLARQSNDDEQQWAKEFAIDVFGLMQRARSDYLAISQAVVAQANLNRFAVVSLLS
jgi:hypothetical protein